MLFATCVYSTYNENMVIIALTKDLKMWINSLEKAGLLHKESNLIDIRNCSAIIAANHNRATLFEKIADYSMPVIANATSSRAMIALALETEEQNVLKEYMSRIARPIPPIYSNDGECQERVTSGADVDLTSLPILFQHELDGAPYISAGMVVAKDPETLDYDIGIYRLMFRKKNELGINMSYQHRLRSFYQKACQNNKPLEIAICIGLHALDMLAAVTTAPVGIDELSVWGGIRREPINLARCKTVDLCVPAHAEIVLEATIQPTGWTENEGPYGEFPGTYSGVRRNPVVKIHAVTNRHSPIYQSATHGGEHLGFTDFFLVVLPTELSIYQALKHAGVDVRAVRVIPWSAGMICYVSINKQTEGESRNALYVALTSPRRTFPKYCIVVDADIDIFNEHAVMWAIGTRTQPKEDVLILEGLRISSAADPSLSGPPFFASKMGIDATVPIEKRSKFEFSRVPSIECEKEEIGTINGQRSNIDRKVEFLQGAIMKSMQQSGPLLFCDILKMFPNQSYRSILSAWSSLRSDDLISESETGRYTYTESGGKK